MFCFVVVIIIKLFIMFFAIAACCYTVRYTVTRASSGDGGGDVSTLFPASSSSWSSGRVGCARENGGYRYYR